MKIIKDLSIYTDKKPLSLSIGMFDGVHRGHQNIIAELNKIADEKNLESGILTFWPHPRLAFKPSLDLKMLNTIEEKEKLLENLELRRLFIQEFNEDFRNISAEDFVREILVKKLNAKHLIIGHDHVFGKNRSGNFNLLRKMSPEMGFEVQEIQAVDFEKTIISSTKIRELLSYGNILEANEMLGYHYELSGEVVHGKKIGRTIGFPTANLAVENIKLLPKNGAYIVEVHIDGDALRGMLSIGTNPTIGENPVTVEVFILNFGGDLYGKNITVKFRDFIHDEIKFESMEKLLERLQEDRMLTEQFIF